MYINELNDLKFIIDNDLVDKDFISNYLNKKGKYVLDKIYYQRRLMRKFIVNRLLTNQGYIYFATFTLNDKHLNNFNRSSFNKYLRRNNIDYILINDYGKDNNRLHFHGFVWSTSELNNECLNHYGFVNFESIDKDNWEKSVYYSIKYSVKFNFDDFKIMYSYKNLKKIVDLLN